MNPKLKWFAIGWATVFGAKYLVFGLDRWNAMFHPGAQIAPNQEPYRKGIFGGNCCQ